MLRMELPGKRKRGRPNRRIMDVVKEDMAEVEVTEEYSRLATRVIAHVTCLPTKLLGESGQQITLAFLPSGWISVLLLTLGPTFQIT